MLLYSLFGASILLVLVCLGLIFVNNNKQSAAIQAKQKQLQETQQQLSILRSEVAEMRAGMLSIGKRVVAVEEKSQELEQLQDAQKYDDPNAKIYSRAVKMVELGADLEEIIHECELPRAEAELLMSLHKQKGA
ncbi:MULTISPECIES: DUF2802 domain-containing protein [Pseudoalteromonas]|jgi:TolA-binding protein|uniref:DUF2802 domain-containing protein n=1 Tax=Pseudoalteromonas lipolytica TaxID=570156 RepID=A0AAD0RZ07_9GAMM|nr:MULTISPECIES: DUF2802 domain-containing protein [Pseudoalteromonas]AXV64663.1 DUF2802 domain-containing protein [Pseudoalteromonas donghaensis]EWH06100.1 hypothetical protein AT00_08735 [Pseudoalteromonas lipolytica SCSIO 04301]MAE02140.1 DUF2802 domain-containing protein [Pseudoalteromonas sp.]MBE0351564.1 hypothetical protein [Pseudoalteromonas lipolytica LMEB 39]MCC9661854.1 DUF2802 domain-containing protein [Pseudoalteromonas sp. MB41]|tara:strand:+ start:821 stop:1222 length:402 start_codon:yes stop_codon:yes gene_type:complete